MTSPPTESRRAGAASAPLPAADWAWIQATTQPHKKTGMPFMASSINMTRAKMTEFGGIRCGPRAS